jgi:hypothetical protein
MPPKSLAKQVRDLAGLELTFCSGFCEQVVKGGRPYSYVSLDSVFFDNECSQMKGSTCWIWLSIIGRTSQSSLQ